jgi:hypothetical protein
MEDGTPWPGNNTRDHPGMIQVKLIFLQQFFLFGRYFPAHSDDIITISKLEIPITLRFSLVTAEALMLRAMNFLVWFMCLVKNVLDSNTTRRLVP